VDQLTLDALRIWHAGVDAVRADRVLRNSLRWDGRFLEIQNQKIDLKGIKRLIIVGAGKAAAGMLEGLLDVFGPQSPVMDPLKTDATPIPTIGWINVPEGAIPKSLSSKSKADPNHRVCGVTICEARPRGINEPTPKALAGTQEILKFVSQATSNDAVIFLLSGGGSALLCAPHEWLSLETKIAITRALSSRGADIQELNAVRRALSQVKGGGLARRSSAGHLVTLVISDVLGDPLEMIGSGPTVLHPPPDARLAAEVLNRYAPGEFPEVHAKLLDIGRTENSATISKQASAHLFVLANNRTAVDAAAQAAQQLGYKVQSESSDTPEGAVQTLSLELTNRLPRMQHRSAWISGGEPTVVLADASVRGQGGRNQHLVLSAAIALMTDPKLSDFAGAIQRGDESIAIVSGGTDGEDGSTHSAGAWIDSQWLRKNIGNLNAINDAFRHCDSHRVFQQTASLIETGPTHTNVCDLRIVLRG